MVTDSLPAVLLAEDSADDAYFFGRALKKTGLKCNFTHVWDGGAAVRFLEETASKGRAFPHLIFLDLKMPVLDGFDVLAWLQEQPSSTRPCVIVLSGSSQEADRRRAAELGAADYLVKPISAPTIAGRIQKIEGHVASAVTIRVDQ